MWWKYIQKRHEEKLQKKNKKALPLFFFKDKKLMLDLMIVVAATNRRLISDLRLCSHQIQSCDEDTVFPNIFCQTICVPAAALIDAAGLRLTCCRLNISAATVRVTLRPLIMCLGDVTSTPHGELLDLTSRYRPCYVNYVRHPQHNHCTTHWGPPVFVSSHISKPQNWDILIILKPLRVNR